MFWYNKVNISFGANFPANGGGPQKNNVWCYFMLNKDNLNFGKPCKATYPGGANPQINFMKKN